ncbi:DNA-binding transcriptional LysR family regulator [Brevibacterium sanguinis]|uniref:DNA-binding transcriptional LysR family regulator n=2 Tax=Brevibacterium TaxID=1696 RepID=A0A366IJQ5_9MICO|nr:MULTISPECIES: LysR family transcriptional regulator [Brevibacterium]RBP65736.1 DNA-binding transcriptional LysR family regulator [Brevibacterium sanguinis]RBP72370.1 DNA-binding transcriptional LysR family regulator [Brevibacterium celere]
MDSRQLAYFRVVIEQGSFTAAAAKLHMTQPSLSLVVQRLEKELGIRLLDRSRLGVRPTEAGSHLYATAANVLDQIDAATLHIRSLADGLAGRVILSSTPIFNWGHLPAILIALQKEAREIDLVLEDPPPDRTVRSVLDGTADIGVVTAWDLAQLKAMYGDRLEMRLAINLPLVAVLPASWAKSVDFVSLHEIREMRWIMPATSTTFPGLPELFEHLWNLRPELRPRSIQKTSGVQTALPLVAAGLGMTIVPEGVGAIADSSIAIRRIDDDVVPLQAVVIWRRSAAQTPAVATVIDLLLDRDRWKPSENAIHRQ